MGWWSLPVRQGAVATASGIAARVCAFSRVVPMRPRMFAGEACPELGGIVSDEVVALTGQTGHGSYRVSARRPCLRIPTCKANMATHGCVWGAPGMGRNSVRRGGGHDQSDWARYLPLQASPPAFAHSHV
jgi:hypothetical protein